MGEVKKDANFIPSLLAEGDDADSTPTPVKAVSTTGRLYVDSNSSDGSSSVGTGRSAIVAANTAQPLKTGSVACKRVWVENNKANSSLANKGLLAVGDSSVDVTEATRQGRLLFPTNGRWFNVSDLSLLYVDGLDTGAKFYWYYEV